jgi:hypothetical protein
MNQQQKAIVNAHRQLAPLSCIPSAVEMILKIHSKEPANYYDQQKQWGNKSNGSFADFDGAVLDGISFKREAFDKSAIGALFSQLVAEIDAGRFPVLSLAMPQKIVGTADLGVVVWSGFHMFLVTRTNGGLIGYAKASPPNGNNGCDTVATHQILPVSLEIWVQLMGGTDILTYQ